MNPERWLQVKEIFHVAAELAPESRAAFLQERCGGDAEMLCELQLLLESHEEAETFIERPALASASEILSTKESELWTGRQIGQYRVVRGIGRGGMGVVLLAVRADDQFRKQVAIKLLRRGMDTEDLLRRFRNERQILASLEHPNIARLIDGGMTEDGLPYFVIEYVEGAPLDKYADEHRLSTSERLQLFRRVCAAVQYAHQNLVVHRDLKPSNILVASTGDPKLLDFGIAKILHPEFSNLATAPTRTDLRVMTPDYASPEQIRGEKLMTTSDVYSLGVVLYELLTGHRPYRAANIPPYELARTICEQEPAKPSAAAVFNVEVVTNDETGPRTTITSDAVSSFRGTTPEKLRSQLAGDLDNIILMAMRKEADRRYASAAQLSEDIERHLEGLPVLARPNTFHYRATKFIKRNHLGVAAASLIVVSLMGGIIATLWQAQAARKERVKAESINAFLEQMLNYANPILNLPRNNSRQLTMTDVLDATAKRLDGGEFSNQPEIKAELERIVGSTYSNQGKGSLGNRHLQEYVALQYALYGENDPRAVLASQTRAWLLFSQGKMIESEKLYRQILPLMRKEQRKGSIKIETLVEALNTFGYLRRTQGDSKEAEALFRETLALSVQIPLQSHYIIGVTHSTLASTLADQGRFEEALQTSREAVAEYRQRGEIDTPDFGFTLTILGGFLTEKGDYTEADANLRDAEAIFRKLIAPSSLWLGDNLRNQAVSLYHQKRYEESLGKVAETLKIYLDEFGPHYDNYPTALIIQGLILTRTGQSNEGEKLIREAIKIRTDSLPKEHYWVALAKSALGECLTIERRYDEAEPFLRESYESLKNSQGASNPRTRIALQRLIVLYEDWRRPDAANEYRSKLT